MMITDPGVYYGMLNVSTEHASPFGLNTKKHQYRAVTSHKKRYGRTFANVESFFSCFLWSVVVWERGNMQRKQRNCFLSPHEGKQGAVWYLSHREGWLTLKVRIIPPLTHFISVVKT